MRRVHGNPSSQICPDQLKCIYDVVHRLALHTLPEVAQFNHSRPPKSVCVGADAFGEDRARKRKPVARLDDIVPECGFLVEVVRFRPAIIVFALLIVVGVIFECRVERDDELDELPAAFVIQPCRKREDLPLRKTVGRQPAALIS